MAKKSKRLAWSPNDVRTPKTLARNKTRAAAIARKLKRTERATRQKAVSMGLSPDTERDVTNRGGHLPKDSLEFSLMETLRKKNPKRDTRLAFECCLKMQASHGRAAACRGRGAAQLGLSR